MVNEKTIDVYSSWCEENVLLGNDSDSFWYEIPSDVKHAVRSNFGIDVAEDILMVRDTSFWNSRDQGLVITDWGIHCIPDNENIDTAFATSWEDIDSLEYKDEVYYFYCKSELQCRIHISFFLKGDHDLLFDEDVCDLLQEMANTHESVDVDTILDDLFNEIEERTTSAEEIEQKSLELIDEDLFSEYGRALVFSRISRAWFLDIFKTYKDESLSGQDKDDRITFAEDKVIEYADLALSTVPEDDLGSLIAFCVYHKVCVMARHSEKKLTAVRLAIDAIGKSSDDEYIEKLKGRISGKNDKGQITPMTGYGIYGDSIEHWQKLHEEDRQNDLRETREALDLSEEERQERLEFIEKHHQEWLQRFDSGQEFFSHRPYQDRQFIFVVKDIDSIGGCYDEADNIKYVFPIDELPGDITFPFGHPQPNTLYYAHPLRPYYLPAEGANLTLFYEKIQEIGRMLQCLGATSITLRCLKGKQISEQVDQMLNVNGEAGNRLISGNTSYQSGLKRGMQQNSRNQMEETKHYNPTRFPYCPPDLLWAALDPQLNHLVKERLEGGLLNFSKKVSSLETMNVTTNRMRDIKGAFDHFMAKVSAHYNAQEDHTFSETEETEWEITAEFKPLNEFAVQMTEQNIVVNAEVIAPLELPSPISMSAEEKEYVEMFLECMADDEGEISARTRRLLDKLAAKSGISADRIAQLESMASQPQLTDDEQEYYDTLKEMLEDDGEITSRERRLLDRLREQSGISLERAREIEKYIIK